MTKAEKMFALVDQWKESGQTQKAFAEQAGIKAATFAYWVGRKKRSEQGSRGGFARVDVSGGATGRLEIHYPNGVKVSAEQWDLKLISQLIALG